MPLYLFKRLSFSRSLKSLSAEQKGTVADILECLIVYYANDCSLSKAKEISPGFFYKQLRKPYYEAGIESNIRIVLRREKQKCIATLAGNHNQIRQFLSKI